MNHFIRQTVCMGAQVLGNVLLYNDHVQVNIDGKYFLLWPKTLILNI